MRIYAIYLDGGPALTETIQNDSLVKRKEILKASLSSPAGQANFLVTRSSQDSLKAQGIIPQTAAIEVITMSKPTQGALATALLPLPLTLMVRLVALELSQVHGTGRVDHVRELRLLLIALDHLANRDRPRHGHSAP